MDSILCLGYTSQLSKIYRQFTPLLEAIYLIRFAIQAKSRDVVSMAADINYIGGQQEVSTRLKLKPQTVKQQFMLRSAVHHEIDVFICAR
ncbi:hypothetical protein CMK12_17970 [Candidatus Poribacteria bacterium]|jgi:hypothetical protein|nr:hypothetical protein [Candidatus Poribacteria bacterium]